MAERRDEQQFDDDSAVDASAFRPISNDPHPFAHPAEQEFATFLAWVKEEHRRKRNLMELLSRQRWT